MSRMSSSPVTSLTLARAHRNAVAEHGITIREREDLLELVADEQQCAARVAQLVHDAEQLRALALRQRGGGLVENEHARFVRQRARNLHHVFLRDAQAAGRHVGVEVRVEIAQHGRCLRAHRGPVHEAAARRLAIHEQVFRDRQVVERQAFLVNHADSERARRLRIRRYARHRRRSGFHRRRVDRRPTGFSRAWIFRRRFRR